MTNYTIVKIGSEFERVAGEKRIAELHELVKSNEYNIEFLLVPSIDSYDVVAVSEYDFEGNAEMKLLGYVTEVLYRYYVMK